VGTVALAVQGLPQAEVGKEREQLLSETMGASLLEALAEREEMEAQAGQLEVPAGPAHQERLPEAEEAEDMLEPIPIEQEEMARLVGLF